ncbi:MAG: ATP-binding protein, partial [Hyphomicrobium sp.]
AVLDARTRADIETRANIELWASHIAARVRSVERPKELQGLADALDVEMAGVRHVSVRVRDPSGHDVTPSRHAAPKASVSEPRAPQWFINLVQPDIASREVDIATHGQAVGSVVITGVPDDEIAEAWELLELLALLWLGAIALTMAGLYFILGLVLDPLARLGKGMRELEIGHFGVRLDMPNVRELEPIATAFNELAAALGEANAENSRLYRQLIAVQEEERREISRDLHDEFGPCLFGIMAATTAVARHAKSLAPEQAAPILGCVEEIVQVSNHLKSLNRALLNRLRPVALGRHTLTMLISELVATFERRHTEVLFDLTVNDLPATFGEGIDLTIYRCVQESVTNAIRHGRAQKVAIEVFVHEKDGRQAVEVGVTDDGRGIEPAVPFGYGLSSMRERINELGGTLKVAPAGGQGTALTATIPLGGTAGSE